MSTINLTWDEVRARSMSRLGAIECHCADCVMNYDMVQMPCLRHCISADERMERHERFMPKVKDDLEALYRVFEEP